MFLDPDFKGFWLYWKKKQNILRMSILCATKGHLDLVPVPGIWWPVHKGRKSLRGHWKCFLLSGRVGDIGGATVKVFIPTIHVFMYSKQWDWGLFYENIGMQFYLPIQGRVVDFQKGGANLFRSQGAKPYFPQKKGPPLHRTALLCLLRRTWASTELSRMKMFATLIKTELIFNKCTFWYNLAK